MKTSAAAMKTSAAAKQTPVLTTVVAPVKAIVDDWMKKKTRSNLAIVLIFVVADVIQQRDVGTEQLVSEMLAECS